MNGGASYREMVEFFERHDFRFQAQPEAQRVFMQMTGQHGSWSFMAICDEENERFLVFSRAPILVPEGKRTAAGEYLTRANWGMIIGNFEMDYSDGEVRYKTSMETDGARLTDRLIGLTVAVNCRMMDRYLPGLMAVVYGDLSPETAIGQVEGRDAGPSEREVEDTVRRLLDSGAPGPTN